MSESRNLLTDLGEGLFADLAGRSFENGWPAIEEAGFATLLIAEDRGGFGGDWGDLFSVMRVAGHHALALPLGETVIVHRLLADLGLDRPGGAITFAADGMRAPWGRDAGHVLLVSQGELRLYPRAQCRFAEGTNPAGEPRDRVTVTGDAIASGPCETDLVALGAFLRIAQVAGALDAALAMSIEHANTREQFGKPLARLQAVQQNLAGLAAEAAAVNIAGQAAAAALDYGDAELEIAAAKIRANQAIGIGTAIAHQVHGAIGFTREYGLHPLTRRLMGWRSEYGNDAYWSVRLGKQMAAVGGRQIWNELTSRTDRQIAAR